MILKHEIYSIQDIEKMTGYDPDPDNIKKSGLMLLECDGCGEIDWAYGKNIEDIREYFEEQDWVIEKKKQYCSEACRMHSIYNFQYRQNKKDKKIKKEKQNVECA